MLRSQLTLFLRFVLLAQVVTMLVLTFRGYHGSWLGGTLAATLTGLMLLAGPGGLPAKPEPRPVVFVAVGRFLLVAGWLAEAVAFGFLGYLVAGVPDGPVFDPRLMVTALVGWVVAALLRAGRALVGFPTGRFRFTGLLRSVLGLVATVLVSGFGHQLEKAASVALCWVPAQAYDLFHSWWATAWFAVPLVVPVWVVWVLVLSAAAGWVIGLGVRLFGADNEFFKWAEGSERRLREADYEPGYGTWTTTRVEISRGGSVFAIGTSDDDAPSRWQRPPTRTDLAMEHHRFPVVRRVRREQLRDLQLTSAR